MQTLISLAWNIWRTVAAVVVLVTVLSFCNVQGCEEPCGECRAPSLPGTLECTRHNGGATTPFSYTVGYRPARWLPSETIVAVYAGPGVDHIICAQTALQMFDHGSGLSYQVSWRNLPVYIVRPLHVDRGKQSRPWRLPSSVLWPLVWATPAYEVRKRIRKSKGDRAGISGVSDGTA